MLCCPRHGLGVCVRGRRALLKHDLETLDLHCGAELMERLGGITKALEEQGRFDDPTILFTSDVEVGGRRPPPQLTSPQPYSPAAGLGRCHQLPPGLWNE